MVKKNFQLLPRLVPPIIQPVAQCYTTELTRLFLAQAFQIRLMYAIFVSSVLAACPAHLILIGSITSTILMRKFSS
jgi:hypothetical protein